MVKLPTAPAVFPQGALQIATHPPIKFVPFAMLDPQTRLPIAPDAIIRLPNGKQGTAKAYYDQLNQYEQWLNEHGQTVRQPEQHAVIEFETMPVDTQLMQRQINASPKPTSIPVQANLLQTHSFKTLSSPVILHIDPSGLSELHLKPLVEPAELSAMTAKVNASCLSGTVVNHFVVNPPALAAIATLLPNHGNLKVDCTLINKSQNWNWDIGDPAKFNAYVNGTIALNGQACRPPNLANDFAGNQSKFALTAEAHAGGYIYHIGGDVLRLTGSAGGDASNNTVNASFGAFVLGQSVYSVNQTANTYWGLDNTISKSVDFSASTIVPLGPINLALTIGAQGTAGVDFSLDLYATHLVGTVSPFVNTSVFAQAGVNAIVVEAGVGVNMVLENANLNLSESAGIGWFYGYYVASDLYADANLNMLGGNVYAYVKYSYPCTDWRKDFWCTTQDNANLYSWNGLQYNSVLFNDQSGMYLNW